MENVFRLNWRSWSVLSRNLNQHGSGLGLYICKKICNGLGGTIRVQSEVGVATTFEFSVPAYRTYPDTDVLATLNSQVKSSHFYHNTLPVDENP